MREEVKKTGERKEKIKTQVHSLSLDFWRYLLKKEWCWWRIVYCQYVGNMNWYTTSVFSIKYEHISSSKLLTNATTVDKTLPLLCDVFH